MFSNGAQTDRLQVLNNWRDVFKGGGKNGGAQAAITRSVGDEVQSSQGDGWKDGWMAGRAMPAQARLGRAGLAEPLTVERIRQA